MPGSQENLSPSVPAPTSPAVPSSFDDFLNGMDEDTLAQYEANRASNDKLEDLFKAYHNFIEATSKQALSAFALKNNEDFLKALNQMLDHFIAKDYIPNDADKAVADAFTVYMTKLATLDSDTYNPFKELETTLDNIETATKQIKKPMHPALKAIIGGIIGAVVGAVICAAVGAGVTWYAAGVGAIPGFFVGLVKGFMAGSTVAMGMTAAIGGASLLTAGLFGGMNHAERKAVDAANAKNTLSADIRADVEAMRQFTPKKAS